MLSVAICIATCERPDGLRALLRSIGGLEAPPRAGWSLSRVVVVDNRGTDSARQIVDEARPRIGCDLHYVVEPRRGIPFARNTAVSAVGGADLVAFIDDDEVATPEWIRELVDALVSTDADVVTGPVIPEFAHAPPAWVREGGFFERPRHRDRARIDYARTSNVIVRARWLRETPQPFSPCYVGGGEDTQFFERVRIAGGAIVWSDRAVVVERIGPERTRAAWIVRRSFRRGQILSKCLRQLEDSPWRRAKRLVHGCLRVSRGICIAAWGLVVSTRLLVSGLREMAFGAGLIAGLGPRPCLDPEPQEARS